MSPLVLTSRENMFWNRERTVDVAGVAAGPEPGSEYACLRVNSDQPDGPMHLAVRRRDGGPWSTPGPGEEVDVMIWQVRDAGVSWKPDGFSPPAARPDAWCTLIGRR